jgi:hypothetical protein
MDLTITGALLFAIVAAGRTKGIKPKNKSFNSLCIFVSI